MKRLVVTILGAALLMLGCAGPNPYGRPSETYQQSETHRAFRVEQGTVVDVEPVLLDASGRFVGRTAGAAIGGLAASTVSSGRGGVIAGIAGAVAGGVAGDKLEQASRRQNGVQITIEMNNGAYISVIQAANPQILFRPGDRVRILTGPGGSKRVIQ